MFNEEFSRETNKTNKEQTRKQTKNSLYNLIVEK